MNIILTAFLLSLASAPAGLGAQPGQAWTIESGPRSSQVNESTARGYAALPASVLVSVGAEVSYARDGVVVQVGSHQVAVANGAAQVTVDGTARPLAHAVYAEGGVVFLPVDFFRELLPGLTGGRVRVDVAGRSIRGSAARPAGTVAEVEEELPVEPAPRPDPARPPQRRLVVVDAGHGGRDPGASGPGGTREKDVTLSVARRLAALLREDPSLEVRMTRDRDTLIALHDRARLANRWRDEGQPALFISVHCNANPSRSEKGYETYFLAEARTADAQRVEAFENASVRYEDAPVGGPLAFILTDLRQNQHLRESSDWAQLIQNRLREIHPGPNRGVKQAGFAVLRGAFMPAVLVEIGFVSNPAEERLLTGDEMQRDVAAQLARSVHDFFARSQQGSESR
ncbi:MAG TPA: N-acetylmuramoyl-L-alanine amidase [Longimicrobium sp.]|jgi:N-acetylmuramoyl-L-alanine amidase